jgi:hypothetical protein
MHEVILSARKFQREEPLDGFSRNVICYATGGDPIFVPFNFLQSVIVAWRTSEFVRWERNLVPHNRFLKLCMVIWIVVFCVMIPRGYVGVTYVWPSALKMEVIFSSETLVTTYKIRRRRNPDVHD